MQPLVRQCDVLGVSIDTIKSLFPTNLETILQFNQELLKQLEERIRNFTPNTTLGDVFLKLVLSSNITRVSELQHTQKNQKKTSNQTRTTFLRFC
jgi:hypothetical protein